MSLKAKIEAVIYASEEPVTLAQLIGLLAQEAQAELDRADSAQGSLSLNETEAELEAAAEWDPSLSGDGPEPGERDTAAEVPDGAAAAEAAAGEGSAAADAAEETPAESGAAEDVAPSLGAPEAGAEDGPAETAGDGLPEQGEAVERDGAVEQSESSDSATDALLEQPEAPEPDPAALARAERARVARLRTYFRSILDGLVAEYAAGDRGLEIREVAGGFRFATKPEYHDAVRGFVRSLKPPLKLSLQALETLAVVAYKQPVTAPEVSEIRGVDSGGVLGSLMARKLVATAGRKQVIGRPILYKTTKDFLLKFGLKDLSELPSIEEFERMAGQMVEQEEIPMPEGVHGDTVRVSGTAEAEGRDPNADVRDEKGSDAKQGAGEDQDVYAPRQPEMEAAADNLDEHPLAKASVDGRISSVPPDYEAVELEDDPSAREAEIQNEQG